MPRKRTLPPTVFQSQRLARCSFPARWLFAGLWGLADREGRLVWLPKYIEGQVFPLDEVNLDELFLELSGVNLMTRYDSGPRTLAAIDPDWWVVHQRPYNREPESDLPPPPPKASSDRPNRGDVNAPRDHPGIIPPSRAPLRDGSHDQDHDPQLRQRARDQKRRSDASALLDFWFDLADRSIAPRGKARAALVAALKVHLVDHAAGEIETMIRHLAQDSWWRGRQSGGPDTDLFSKRPISWMRKTKAAEFADRVEAAREWAQAGAPEARNGDPATATSWLGSNADWFLRLRDQATSYGTALDEATLIDRAASAHRAIPNPQTAGELLSWLETR